MRKISWMVLAILGCAAQAQAQSQFQSTFELGVGYTRPATENIDMVSFLVQADDFLAETGIGFRTNSGQHGETVFSWMVRGGFRPFTLGNVTGHVGAEFSLHSNAALQDDGSSGTLIGLGLMVGVSHQIADHLNLAVHVFPLAFDFGGVATVTKIGVAEIGAHLLF